MVCEHEVVAIDGTVVPLNADSVCVHGDSPSAVAMARAVRARLESEGVADTRVRRRRSRIGRAG